MLGPVSDPGAVRVSPIIYQMATAGHDACAPWRVVAAISSSTSPRSDSPPASCVPLILSRMTIRVPSAVRGRAAAVSQPTHLLNAASPCAKSVRSEAIAVNPTTPRAAMTHPAARIRCRTNPPKKSFWAASQLMSDTTGSGLTWRKGLLPTALYEDRPAAFHEDESAAVVDDRRCGVDLYPRNGLPTANGH
jgi:hypothetical protein